MTIRLLIAEDNFLLREGVVRMLSTVDEVDIVASCADLPEALAAIAEHRPDVVLTDIRMPPTRSDEGLKVAAYCRRQCPGTAVVLLSQYVEISYVRTLLTHGTDGRGYLLKERVADLEDLLVAIRAVTRGGSAIDPKVIEALVTVKTRTGDVGLARLSPRERDVLECVAQGRTNAAVATELVLTTHAVEKHINSIFSKLGLAGQSDMHPRVRAALLYLTQGAN